MFVDNRPLPKPPVDTPPPSLPTRQSTQYPNDHVFRNSHAGDILILTHLTNIIKHWKGNICTLILSLPL